MKRGLLSFFCLVLFLFVVSGTTREIIPVSAAGCDGQSCSTIVLSHPSDCCPEFQCSNGKCIPCLINWGNFCPTSEDGKRKCIIGWSAITYYDEVRECMFNSVTNCHMYLKVENCKNAGLTCKEDGKGGASCVCPNSCTPGQKRCKEVNSLPISPPGPDEIQTCGSDQCSWATIQYCSMDQDCVVSSQGNPECVDKQCPYCCPSGKTCSAIVYGVGCSSGESCCGSSAYCTETTCQNECATVGEKQCKNISAYKNCTSVGSCRKWSVVSCYNGKTCSNGACVSSGNPPANPNIFNLAEVITEVANAITKYSSGSTNLSLAELKDLVFVSLSAPGNTIDLSGIGAFSSEKLIDIYNKAKGVASCTPATCSSLGKQCGSWPDGCGGTLDCGNCNYEASGICVSSGYCVDGIVLPWGLNVGMAGAVVYGIERQKRTYILRVPPGTEFAGARFYAYDPATVFNFTFTSVPGYKWRGYESYTGTVRYSSDAGFDFTPETMTPTPTDGFVPPGDYIVEITWTSPPYIPYGCPGCLGRILIVTVKS